MVFFDVLRVKIREDAVIRNKAIYLELGVLSGSTRDILGLWIENTKGVKFCMKVFNDPNTRSAETSQTASHTEILTLPLSGY